MGAFIVDKGTTNEAGKCFYELGEAVLNPFSLMAGCAPPAETELQPELAVVVFSRGLNADMQGQLESGFALLGMELKRLSTEYPDYPYRNKILKGPYPFLKRDPYSLENALAVNGTSSIKDLFIFGHGWSDQQERVEPAREPELKDTVGGIDAERVASVCVKYMDYPARVQIYACLQQVGKWEALSTPDVKFEVPYHFHNRELRFYESINAFIQYFHYYDKDTHRDMKPMPFFVRFGL